MLRNPLILLVRVSHAAPSAGGNALIAAPANALAHVRDERDHPLLASLQGLFAC